MSEAGKLTWGDARPCSAAGSRGAEIARKTKKIAYFGRISVPDGVPGSSELEAGRSKLYGVAGRARFARRCVAARSAT